MKKRPCPRCKSFPHRILPTERRSGSSARSCRIRCTYVSIGQFLPKRKRRSSAEVLCRRLYAFYSYLSSFRIDNIAIVFHFAIECPTNCASHAAKIDTKKRDKAFFHSFARRDVSSVMLRSFPGQADDQLHIGSRPSLRSSSAYF